MRFLILALLIIYFCPLVFAAESLAKVAPMNTKLLTKHLLHDDQSIYPFELKTLAGEQIALSKYIGKVVLIVNTASRCGLTPQFKELEEIYQSHKDRGFVVLGFPCNQFANQDPGTAEEIKNFCTLNYGVTFPMFEKVRVNGEGSHPLYNLLKKNAPTDQGQSDIQWNFTKFLINKKGYVVKRFAPQVSPRKIVPEIESLISQKI